MFSSDQVFSVFSGRVFHVKREHMFSGFTWSGVQCFQRLMFHVKRERAFSGFVFHVKREGKRSDQEQIRITREDHHRGDQSADA